MSYCDRGSIGQDLFTQDLIESFPCEEEGSRRRRKRRRKRRRRRRGRRRRRRRRRGELCEKER